MSKKYRKQKRKGSTWIAVVTVVTGLAFIFAGLRTFRSSSNPPEVTGGRPAVSVDRKLIDFGNLKDYTVKTISIKVTNSGTGMLRFTDKPYVEVVEGCCPPDLSVGKMSLRPGESTTVTSTQFFMHPGMDGKHNFAVHMPTNDPAEPDFVINVLSNWSQ